MENNEQIVETETTTTENVETTVEEKTFTQKEFDEALQRAVARKTKNLPSADELKSFNEWKKTNQNDSEKINELTAQLEQATKENTLLKATNEVAKSDVKPEFLKFVTSEVMSMVNETTDFDTALKNYKKENTQYFGEVVVKKVQTSPTLTGGTKPQTTNDIMNSLLRGTKN
ncbi:MAG: hypothetical protein IKN65_00790 [Clostridia bacterium]|nr:hypothetical protein [Bacilli bacterium]MBR3672820.1 hypothetical protein [Clostridia bacterium]